MLSGGSLHVGVAGVQWTLTGYLLAVAALLLLSGALADRFGRRRLVTVGLCTMLGAAVCCALAASIGVLIGARIAREGNGPVPQPQPTVDSSRGCGPGARRSGAAS
ncbi:MAG: MFS transporter [Solirubrobacteraceae bacterium]